jgi:ankyrin repeat-rich membrane spanning protein
MKIFLPFTINLDPYLKKLVKEEVQTIEAVSGNVCTDLPQPPASQIPAPSSQLAESELQQLMRHVPPAFARSKLSDLSVEDVCDLMIAALHNGKAPLSADSNLPAKVAVRNNNISGRVLSVCDMAELRGILGLNFGDWNLFRLALVSMRELEIKGLVECPAAAATAVTGTHSDCDNLTTTNVAVVNKELVSTGRPLRRRDSVEKQAVLPIQLSP